MGLDGKMHCSELERLCELAVGRDVLEIGAYAGQSAWAMAISAKSVTSVDTFQAATCGQRQTGEFTTLDKYMEATARFKNTHIVIGQSQNVELGQEKFGMIFLDAMHDYENVRADLKKWWPHLLPGGVLAVHDYHHADYPGVAQAVDEFLGPLPNVEVTLGWMIKGG